MIERDGDLLVDGLHLIGLFVIGAAIIWATITECIIITGHYVKTKHLPVRFLPVYSHQCLDPGPGDRCEDHERRENGRHRRGDPADRRRGAGASFGSDRFPGPGVSSAFPVSI